MHTWVYGGVFQPLNTLSPSKSNLSTKAPFLLTTTPAQGLNLIQQSISCVFIFKPLQDRHSHPFHKTQSVNKKKGFVWN